MQTTGTPQRRRAHTERRKAPRYAVSALAFYRWQRADGTLQQAEGISRDISHQGVFILATDLPIPGVRVELALHLPAVNETLRPARLHGEGTVVRTAGPEGGESGFAAAVEFHTERSDGVAVPDSGRIH